uniref:Uncharacterized protein n=1 Tax=Anguilla anguilla TaxID=7936 RepID=A0A0E9UE45_ANGAN
MGKAGKEKLTLICCYNPFPSSCLHEYILTTEQRLFAARCI